MRLEDGPLLAGEGKFSADWTFPDMLYMHVAFEVACGSIRSIDTSAATSSAGVHTIWTATDIPEIPPIQFRHKIRDLSRTGSCA